MILKFNDTEKSNVLMTLHIDDEAEKITVRIRHWNKPTGIINKYEYPASEYSKALAKFKELENIKIAGKLKATNILWDVDYYDYYDDGELPTEIDIPEGMTDEDEISDYLSEVTGYCHQGFELEEK